jgi:rhodanese-related sulfurtransferase
MKSHAPRFLALVAASKAQIQEISVSDLLDSSNSPILIDVREESEWKRSHASGAIHMGKGILERDIESTCPDLSAYIVLYCGGGYRSALAADALQQMGYNNVYSLAGGFRAWNAGRAPTVEDS